MQSTSPKPSADPPTHCAGSDPPTSDRQCLFCDKTEQDGNTRLLRVRNDLVLCHRCIRHLGELIAERDQSAAWAELQQLPSPRAIRARLDEYVIGQDRAKVDLAVAVYNHYKRRRYAQEAGASPEVEIQKSNILLMGPTGTGKTELARAMARLLGVPFHVADATKLTAMGYMGDDVESILHGLIASAQGHLQRAEWGIVLIDEFDKLARPTGRLVSGYRDIGAEAVQQALLRMIEGQRMKLPQRLGIQVTTAVSPLYKEPEVDTTNILFICAGSFAATVEAVVDRRVNRSARIGFAGNGTSRRDLTSRELYELVSHEDALDMGIIPELVGRLPVLTSTLPLTEDEMVRILTEPKHSIVKQLQALLAMEGVELEIEEDALRRIGREALSRPTGARGLRGILEELLKKPVYEHAGDPALRAIRITRACVEGRQDAVVERAERAAEGQADGK